MKKNLMDKLTATFWRLAWKFIINQKYKNKWHSCMQCKLLEKRYKIIK